MSSNRVTPVYRGRTGLQLNALYSAVLAAACTGGAFAQAPAPAASASEANVSEQAKRAAASPYKWIINTTNNAQRQAPKRDAAATPAAPAAPTPSAAAPVAAAPAGGNSAQATAAAAQRRQEQEAQAKAAEEAAKKAAPASTAVAAAPAVVPVVAAPPAPAPAPAPVVAAAPPPPAAAPAPAPAPVKKLNTELVIVTQVEPRLPPAVMRDLTEGSVKVAFTVNPDGTTSDIKIVSSSARSLNNPVMAAIKDFKYQPIDIATKTELELAFKF